MEKTPYGTQDERMILLIYKINFETNRLKLTTQ